MVAARRALVLLPLTGAALLIAAEFSTLYEIRVVTTVPEGGSSSAGAHHGFALAALACGIAVMGCGAALGGSRPAAAAIVVLALAALGVALLIDLPDTDETGLIGRTYEAARAEPGPAVVLELVGAGVALAGGLALFVTAPARRRLSQRRRAAPAR